MSLSFGLIPRAGGGEAWFAKYKIVKSGWAENKSNVNKVRTGFVVGAGTLDKFEMMRLGRWRVEKEVTRDRKSVV